MIKRLVIDVDFKKPRLTERLVKDNIISIRIANFLRFFLLILVLYEIIA